MRTEPGTPLGAVQLRELMEDVLDLFIKGSSTTREFALRFRVPGLGTSKDGAPLASRGSKAE